MVAQAIGKEIAKTLELEFYDSDEEITKKTGKTPAQIILESGESAFRDIESEVIKDLSVKSGAVISLGGGAVLREENVINLKRNGTIVYIKRDLNLLTCKNRPLSKEQGIEKLFEVRNPIYERVSDIKVENDKDIKSCVKKVIEIYENTCN